MPKIVDVHFRPPLAFARLGGSSIPLDNYRWTEDPSIHGASRTVVEPATTLQVLPDGSALPYLPSLLRFSDSEGLRPVAPFFELWAKVEYTAADAEKDETHKAGEQAEVPLTSTLLREAGGEEGGVMYTVHVANRKAARRTGDDANGFESLLRVNGQDHGRHELLASTPLKPGREPLVFADRPISLGAFQVVRPMARAHIGVNLDVLRVRFTPARGKVYGPPSAVVGQSINGEGSFEIVPPENRILNPASSWLRYDADYATYMNPEPFDTYDGADQDEGVAWGVVDDTCDGIIRADVVVGAQRWRATARVCAGPPDYAPDRRPFVSLADDLTDRDEEPLSVEQMRTELEASRAFALDLFERAFETAGLMSVDMVRARAVAQNGSAPQERVGGLPFTDNRSMTSVDAPYADDKVTALVPDDGAATRATPLPFTALVPLAHNHLAQSDELIRFVRESPARVRQMVRPAFGAVKDLDPSSAADATPSPDHRDPRIDRDLLFDMRMPPYMRDEMAQALSLTRKQYVELLRYIDIESGTVARSTVTVAAHMSSPDAARTTTEDTALRRRVRAVLHRLHEQQGSGRRR